MPPLSERISAFVFCLPAIKPIRYFLNPADSAFRFSTSAKLMVFSLCDDDPRFFPLIF